MQNPKQTQLEITERLQLKWLERMEKLLDEDDISATEMNTLAQVMMRNGWNLDPSALPQGLKDKITSPDLDFDEDEDDPDVIAIFGT